MSLSLAEMQALNEIAAHLYDFLPGTPHPYANQSISFAGVASELGLSHFWTGGSKQPAITTLLSKTLEFERGRFGKLIKQIVMQGITYRKNKGKPITREEIEVLNELINGVGFKFRELWDSNFLNGLPTEKIEPKAEKQEKTNPDLSVISKKLFEMQNMTGQARGFAFEKLLNDLFAAFDLQPKGAFKLVGEQIDGSFQIGTDTYLVEAKWHGHQISHADLLVFHGKVDSKARWSRGLFISYSGFTEDGLTAFSKGRSTNIIGMDSQDIYFILNGEMPLAEVITLKARRAAETGEFYVPVYRLVREG